MLGLQFMLIFKTRQQGLLPGSCRLRSGGDSKGASLTTGELLGSAVGKNTLGCSNWKPQLYKDSNHLSDH